MEREWVPGAEQLLQPADGTLRGMDYHRRNRARMAAMQLMERLFPADEPETVAS